MVLNWIWISFFLIAFVVAVIRLCMGDASVFQDIMDSTFSSAKTGFEISLGLTGVLSLWLGIMKIGEKGGLVNTFARRLTPIFSRLFPDLPKDDPAYGHIFMNFAANMLGLDNAATPMGLKAMERMQQLNEQKERASDPMIMFLVINTSGLTLIPVSILVYRAQLGAAQPADVFIPILLATFFSTMVGLLATCLVQRIRFDRVLVLFLGGLSAVVALIIWGFTRLPAVKIGPVSTSAANIILLLVIMGFIISGIRAKINVYEAFVEGAKDGFHTAVRIIPYLVAILVGIGVFRASGAMDSLVGGIGWLVEKCGLDNRFVGALPTALMKPLSGGGARGMMIDAMTTYGVDSFVGRLACLFQGSTDTTFYILAVYFGSVNIKNTRNAVSLGLLADLAGILAAIFIGYLFFG
ncbi:MAG TPA: nucleoside recognition domain-containing protein [Bacteroidaceae bacterium]|jgi:spore maturation protein SpmA|nr:MAG: Spore maturation protein A [Bacteroidetes bacterium ADurb.BinA104]HPX98664.1 nucleoside recognition domain-containing protein [Bacteroidaceae bacterium]